MSLKRQLAEDQGFLNRWSRLKRQQSRPEIEEPVAEERGETDAAAVAQPAAGAVEASDELDLPEIDSLGAGSDFKPFMNPKVPVDLRRQALRKLWASNPLYNRIDMLDDYCEDYTDKAMVVPGMKTAYKVGRGFLDKFEELASQDESIAAKTEDDRADVIEEDDEPEGSGGLPSA